MEHIGKLVLLRHGQTVWSESGQYTGRTNIPLTTVGRAQAVDAGVRLHTAFPNGFRPENIYTSDLKRAVETAELAGFSKHQETTNLEEWDYGRAEGRTREQLNDALGFEWNVWNDGPRVINSELGGTRVEMFDDGTSVTVVNGEGEPIEDAAARTREVIAQAMPALLDGQDVLLVAHAHILRILTSQWLGLPPQFGRNLHLDTAHFCVLGIYKGDHVIYNWNL
ncbi:histidine phosphatase family protein [Bifidobacterium canis]|uniref:histidine phosphatase family protein n=1 Tax=Bifidobacterium canis TaxID=2610880 RepID=UPI0031B5A3AF